jgi:Na+-translocating ferredoxin:NAD+ oxidoreductase RnfD subunit
MVAIVYGVLIGFIIYIIRTAANRCGVAVLLANMVPLTIGTAPPQHLWP